MRKIFVAAFMAMGISSAFAQSNVTVNDTIINDTTKKSIAYADTVIIDTTKTKPAEPTLMATNDTVVNDTTQTTPCPKDTEKIILALQTRKHTVK